MELLEYLIRVSGGAESAAQAGMVRKEFQGLGKAAAEADAAQAKGAGSSTKLAAGMSAVRYAAAGGGIALAAAGLAAVKLSNTFDTEMLKIRTEGGATSAEFNRMKGAVNELAKSGQSMGQGPTALAQGMYHLESMGLRGSKALLALKLASEEAAISGAKLEDTTTAVGGAMYIALKGTGSVAHMMGTLNAIAGSGNMRFQQLNEALGTGLLSAAKVAGLSLREMGAALAVLTDAGTPASSAAAQLGTALHYLYAPTSKAQTALATIGLSGNQLADDLRKPQGILAALQDLQAHMQGLGKNQQADVLNSILPGGRGRVLLNLYELQSRLAPKYQQIGRTSGDFGKHVMEQAGNAATKSATKLSEFQGHMVDLGHAVGPLVNGLKNFGLEAGGWLAGALAKVIGFLNSTTDAVMHLRAMIGAGGVAGFWNGLMQGLAHVVLFIQQQFNGLISAYNNTLGQLPGAPTISLIPLSGTASAAGLINGPNGTFVSPGLRPGTINGPNGTRVAPGLHPGLINGPHGTWVKPGLRPKAQKHVDFGSGLMPVHTGDVVVHIGGHEFARVTRREIQKAMMAGA